MITHCVIVKSGLLKKNGESTSQVNTDEGHRLGFLRKAPDAARATIRSHQMGDLSMSCHRSHISCCQKVCFGHERRSTCRATRQFSMHEWQLVYPCRRRLPEQSVGSVSFDDFNSFLSPKLVSNLGRAWATHGIKSEVSKHIYLTF
ncbi:hypothetical protein PoB_007081000 [Plakobranchus ocellatus]|uniref:Uncharacterized protein n=1 Tax=Plakobranchus ocellatus TaxID=259542 RepID=A0AAV4DJI7_9GAST|nr:hypothetical protein PoB_007081000 [Plakobranchus ocellatus]